MEFTKEDQYLTQAMTERFKNKYGNVAVIAIDDTQMMAVSGGLSSEQTIEQLLKLIEQMQTTDKHEEASEE